MKGEREPPKPQRTASNSQGRYLPKAKSNGKRPDSEFDRFERLTKRLIQVPKMEIDEKSKKKG